MESVEWKNIEYFDESFDKRTAALIELLDNRDFNSILDVGCGMGFAKKHLLSKGIEGYTGLDYKKRNSETLVCDLNNKEFANKNYDLFLIAGCLEYVEDPDWFFQQMGKCNKEVLLSYCVMEYNSDMNVRHTNAWKNHLSADDIITKMNEQGFCLKAKKIYREKTVLFNFRRRKSEHLFC